MLVQDRHPWKEAPIEEHKGTQALHSKNDGLKILTCERSVLPFHVGCRDDAVLFADAKLIEEQIVSFCQLSQV